MAQLTRGKLENLELRSTWVDLCQDQREGACHIRVHHHLLMLSRDGWSAGGGKRRGTSWGVRSSGLVMQDVDRSDARLRPTRFEEFYRVAWEEVYRPLAATLRDADLAAEAVDEAMVRCFVRWSTVAEMENREGWVYRVAYRYGVDRLRRRQAERRLLPRLLSRQVQSDRWVEPALGGALDRLPVDQRAVVVLAYTFDWSHQEIAAALGIRPGTVKSRLSRALQRLREEIGS